MNNWKGAELATPVARTPEEIRRLPAVYGLDRCSTVYLAPEAVYRVVEPNGESPVRFILSKGLMEGLVAGGLVDTEVCRFLGSSHALVLRHRRVDFVTVPAEWCPTMLVEAARLLCTLSLDLDKHGLMLKDGHALNVTFDGGVPVFLDFGSLAFRNDGLELGWLEEFRSRVLVPLWVASAGYKELARQILKTEPRGLGWCLARTRVGRRLPPWFAHVRRTWRKRGWRACLGELLDRLDSVSVPIAQSNWTSYVQRFPEEKALKEQIVLQHLHRRMPKSVHDLGANIARTGQLVAAQLGIPVCSSDISIDCVELAYRRTRSMGIPLSLAVLDVMFPIPAYGAGASRPGSVERLRADTALALALVHHLVAKSRIGMETFARVVSDYCTCSAVVEFIHPQDKHLESAGFPVPVDYHLEGFIRAFLQHFTGHQPLPVHHPTRRLVEFTR